MGLSLSRRLSESDFIQARRKVIMDGIQYTLTRAQFHLLHLLAAYEGQLVSHSEIIQIITKERTESRRP